MKYFRMPYREVVCERSYLNILLLNASIPSYHTDTAEDGEDGVDEKPLGKPKARRKQRELSEREREGSNYFMRFM